MYTLALIVVALILLVYLLRRYTTEDFETKREKASAIVEWFNRAGDTARYNSYKASVPESDIVEYDRARALHVAGPLSVKIIEKLL